MRILVYGINFTPELTGIGKYTGELYDWLKQRGHEVRVVTAAPYYPDWKVFDGYSAWRYGVESAADCAVYRCPLWVPQSPSGIKRIIHLFSFAITSLPLMLRQMLWHPDVVMVIEPPFFCAPTALIVGMLCGARTLLHVQDFEVDAAFDLNLIKSGMLRRIVMGAEKILLRCFDRVSTISHRMMDRLKVKGVDAQKTLFFPNWVDASSIFPIDRDSPMRKELNIGSDRVVALYSGNMGEKQGLELVIEAARKLQDHPRLTFVMCGTGAAYSRLRKMAEDLPNLVWLPLQPVDKLNDLLNMADIHLLPQSADVTDLVMPSKLTGMLASGRPVVATALPGTQVAQVLDKAGIVVPPGDVLQFVEALLSLAQDINLRETLGREARRYALKNLDRDAVLARFEQDLNALCRIPGLKDPDGSGKSRRAAGRLL